LEIKKVELCHSGGWRSLEAHASTQIKPSLEPVEVRVDEKYIYQVVFRYLTGVEQAKVCRAERAGKQKG